MFRRTLKTSESLEWQASARPRARSMRREQRVLVKYCANERNAKFALAFYCECSQYSYDKIFPECPGFSSFFPKRTR